jgi:hypothetical protein
MAPSTPGTLRAFIFGHVRQLDRLTEQLLTRAWTAGAGTALGQVRRQRRLARDRPLAHNLPRWVAYAI